MADSFLNIKLTGKGKLLKVAGNKISFGSQLNRLLSDKGILKKEKVAIAKLIKEEIEDRIISKGLINTGKLYSSVVVDSSGVDVVVRMAKTKYRNGTRVSDVAIWQNEGTKRHYIKPKKPGGTLAWTVGSRTFFSKGHFVSGVKAQKFFRTTKTNLNRYVKSVIKDRLFK